MKNIRAMLLTVFLLLPLSALAAGGLNAFLDSVNVQARADQNGFTAKVSAQFGVPEAQVRVVLGNVSAPADAFMVFQLGQMANQSPDSVLRVYRANKGRGWGVMAQQLGIKPGSPEFFALKRGDLHFGPDQGSEQEPGRGHGRGQGRGHGAGRGNPND